MTDIHLVGLGISSVFQITAQAIQALRQSEEVFYLDTGVATDEYLRQFCPRVTSLYAAHYAEGRGRLNAYNHMAAMVIDAALDHPPVTFAVHGHPLIAASAPSTVLKLAGVLDLAVDCQPGISAIDTVFADLGVDPVSSGCQMYEATDLLLRRRPLQPDVPALLWQIGSLESTLHTQRRSLPERFHRFVTYLLGYYAPTHRVTAIYSSPHPLMDSTTIECELSHLPDYSEELHAGFTLYVPATHHRAVRDLDLWDRLGDPRHLKRLTR